MDDVGLPDSPHRSVFTLVPRRPSTFDCRLGAMAFVLVNALKDEMIVERVAQPTFSSYERLSLEHARHLRCSCSNMLIPYERFLRLSADLHSICSHPLISDRWIALLRQISTGSAHPDWRNLASSQFQFLADLCQLTNATLDDALRRFHSQSFVASDLLNNADFDGQISRIIDDFRHSTVVHFGLLIKTIRTVNQVNQFYSGPIITDKSYDEREKLFATLDPDDPQLAKVFVREEKRTSTEDLLV